MEEEEGMGSALDLDALGDVEGEASAAVEVAEVLGGILDKVADTEAELLSPAVSASVKELHAMARFVAGMPCHCPELG
jgi:hypothetical protein